MVNWLCMGGVFKCACWVLWTAVCLQVWPHPPFSGQAVGVRLYEFWGSLSPIPPAQVQACHLKRSENGDCNSTYLKPKGRRSQEIENARSRMQRAMLLFLIDSWKYYWWLSKMLKSRIVRLAGQRCHKQISDDRGFPWLCAHSVNGTLRRTGVFACAVTVSDGMAEGESAFCCNTLFVDMFSR